MPDTPPPTVSGRFEWDVPDELFDERFREEEFLRQLKEDAVVKLFEAGRVSSGYAASLLGMTQRDFLELLQKHGVPLVSHPSPPCRLLRKTATATFLCLYKFLDFLDSPQLKLRQADANLSKRRQPPEGGL